MPEQAVFAVVHDANGDLEFLRNLFTMLPQAVSEGTGKKLGLVALIGNTPGSQMTPGELKEFDSMAWKLLVDEYDAHMDDCVRTRKIMNPAELASHHSLAELSHSPSEIFRKFIGVVDAGAIQQEGILVNRFKAFYRDLGKAMTIARSKGIGVKVMGTNIFHSEALNPENYLDWQKITLGGTILVATGLEGLEDAVDAPLLAYRTGTTPEKDSEFGSRFYSDMKEANVIISTSVPAKERLIEDTPYLIIAGQRQDIDDAALGGRREKYPLSRICDELSHVTNTLAQVGVYICEDDAWMRIGYAWKPETTEFVRVSSKQFSLSYRPDSGVTMVTRRGNTPGKPGGEKEQPGTSKESELAEETDSLKPLALEMRIKTLEEQLNAAKENQRQAENARDDALRKNMDYQDKIKQLETDLTGTQSVLGAVIADPERAVNAEKELKDILETLRPFADYVKQRHSSINNEGTIPVIEEYIAKELWKLDAPPDQLQARVSELEQNVKGYQGDLAAARRLFTDMKNALAPVAAYIKRVFGGRISEEKDPWKILQEFKDKNLKLGDEPDAVEIETARKRVQALGKELEQARSAGDADVAGLKQRIARLEEETQQLGGMHRQALEALGKKDEQREALETDYLRQIERKDKALLGAREELQAARRNIHEAPDRLVAIVQGWASGKRRKDTEGIALPPGKALNAVLDSLWARVQKKRMPEDDKAVLSEAYDAMLQKKGYADRIAGLRSVIVSNPGVFRRGAAGKELRLLAAASCAYLSSTGFPKKEPREYWFIKSLATDLQPLLALSGAFEEQGAIAEKAHSEEVVQKNARIGELESSIDSTEKNYHEAVRLSAEAMKKFDSAPKDALTAYLRAYEIAPYKETRKSIACNIGAIFYDFARAKENLGNYRQALKWLRKSWRNDFAAQIADCVAQIKKFSA